MTAAPMQNNPFAEAVLDGSLLVAAPIALLAGIVSFLSPCVLPLMPGYLGYVTGLGGERLQDRRRSRLVLGALLFVLGAAAFGFLVPALAGYIAFAIADRPGIAPGFVMGAVAGITGSGFIGGIVGGVHEQRLTGGGVLEQVDVVVHVRDRQLPHREAGKVEAGRRLAGLDVRNIGHAISSSG